LPRPRGVRRQTLIKPNGKNGPDGKFKIARFCGVISDVAGGLRGNRKDCEGNSQKEKGKTTCESRVAEASKLHSKLLGLASQGNQLTPKQPSK
jgi:hypothetical protein